MLSPKVFDTPMAMIEFVGPLMSAPPLPSVKAADVLGAANLLSLVVPTYNLLPSFVNTTGATNAAYSVGVLVPVFIVFVHAAPPNPARPVVDLYHVPYVYVA